MAVPVFVGDRVLVSTDTTGTGTYDLGTAVSGYLSPADAGVTTGVRVAYVVVDSLTNPSTFEVGEGTYTAGTPATISRTLIVRNSSGGTSAISWSAGTKYLFLAPSASRFVMYDSDGGFTLNTHLTLASGDAASVAVSTPGDRNTGLFFPGENKVALTSGASTIFEVADKVSWTSNEARGPNIAINGNQINEWATDASAEVAVNYNGYNNGTTRFRDLAIYDGKNGTVATFRGADKSLTVNGYMRVTASAGQFRPIDFLTGSSRRFGMGVNDAAETGSNAGSDFYFVAFSDADVFLGDVFEITRATRKLDFKVTPSVNGTDLTGNLGTITEVSAGTGLTGGGASGAVTLSVATTHGAIGTYTYAQYFAGGTIFLDGTTAGSNLSPTKSGTWKLMGTENGSSSVGSNDYGLWLRIS